MASLDVAMLTRSLMGGMESEAFDRDIREKRVAKFDDAIAPAQLEQLCSLPKLETLLRMEAIPVLSVDLFDHGNLRRLVDVQNKSGKSSFAVITESLRRGETLRVRDIDKFDPGLRRLVREIRTRFAAQSQINVYLTPARQSGFAPHFDTTDVFVVQCLGAKEWRIHPGYSNKRELPLMDTSWDPERFQPSSTAKSLTLQAGDVLYIPRGEMHSAFCTERESLHLTISIAPLTFADLIAKALRATAESDERYRRRVPWSLEGNEAGAAVLDEARELLSELAGRIDIRALLSAERDTLDPAPETGTLDGLKSAIATQRR